MCRRRRTLRRNLKFATSRQPTALTPVLQIALPATFALDQLLFGVQIWTSVPSPNRLSWIPTFVVFFLLSCLLAFGSFRRWTWAYWVLLVFLGLAAVGDVITVLFPGVEEGFLHNSSIVLLAPLLFGVGVYCLIRYGPWAQE